MCMSPEVHLGSPPVILGTRASGARQIMTARPHTQSTPRNVHDQVTQPGRVMTDPRFEPSQQIRLDGNRSSRLDLPYITSYRR